MTDSLAVDVEKTFVAIHYAGDVMPDPDLGYVVRAVEPIDVRADVADVKGEGAIAGGRSVDVVPEQDGVIAATRPAEDACVVDITCGSQSVKLYPCGKSEVSVRVDAAKSGDFGIVSGASKT